MTRDASVVSSEGSRGGGPAARRCRALGALLLVFHFSLFIACGQNVADPTLEYKVKAGFLYNFAKFVQWPTQLVTKADAPVVVGLLSYDPAAPVVIQALKGKLVNGRSFQVSIFDDLDELPKCHLLFVSRAHKNQLPEVLKRLDRVPVLTVSETDDFAQRGGMINFVRSGESFRFEINVEVAERAGLSISSKLASMATIVKNRTPR